MQQPACQGRLAAFFLTYLEILCIISVEPRGIPFQEVTPMDPPFRVYTRQVSYVQAVCACLRHATPKEKDAVAQELQDLSLRHI